MSESRGGRRGTPVWSALAALVLVPLVGVAVLSGVTGTSAARQADQAARAGQLVSSVGQLDAVRRAVDAEVLPTLLLGLLREGPARAAGMGFAPARQSLLRLAERQRLTRLRGITDRAVAELMVLHSSLHGSVPAEVGDTLRQVRTVADAGSAPLEDVADRYSEIAVRLFAAERRGTAQAISGGLSADSVDALQDLALVVQLSETASRQLGQLFASRVLPGPAAAEARRAWVASWGAFVQVIDRSALLATDRTRGAWDALRSSSEFVTFSATLGRQALAPERTVLQTGALPGLLAQSVKRDQAVAVVLDYAVGAVAAGARADQASAVRRERTLLMLGVAMTVLSLLNAGLIARWLTLSMRSLAGTAEEISHGRLVDVRPSGPRELRTAGVALSSAVAGLRRVQQQARAVVAGDLDEALRQEPLPGPLGEVVHASVTQIVDAFRSREELREELAHQASHDALTGLANRAATLERLASSLVDGQHGGLRTGVLFIDLDGFKAVNDSHGHAAGDQLLREVADRLTATVRPGDTVGRLGGDEFVVTVGDVSSVSDLVDVAERLIDAVSRPVVVGTGEDAVRVRVGASIGIAVSSGTGPPEVLLAEADQATYRAKRLGRGRVEVFDDAFRAELAERADLDVALRAALAGGDLTLVYQPVVELAGGTVVGYEALCRWTRPGFGPVRPDVFIAMAETSSLVCDLGRWVLREATGQLAAWRAAGRAGCGGDGPEPSMAVNLSGRHLAESRVLADVEDALAGSGLPAELLVVEITETTVTDNRAVRHLKRLRQAGVRIAIDDFGTGYTSIGALASTPADILKVDRSFVSSDDPARHRLATLITSAAHTFSLRVVAEGIETPEQLARARADGCDDGQGYLFAAPAPASVIESLDHPLHGGAGRAGVVPDPRRAAEKRSSA